MDTNEYKWIMGTASPSHSSHISFLFATWPYQVILLLISYPPPYSLASLCLSPKIIFPKLQKTQAATAAWANPSN